MTTMGRAWPGANSLWLVMVWMPLDSSLVTGPFEHLWFMAVVSNLLGSLTFVPSGFLQVTLQDQLPLFNTPYACFNSNLMLWLQLRVKAGWWLMDFVLTHWQVWYIHKEAFGNAPA